MEGSAACNRLADREEHRVDSGSRLYRIPPANRFPDLPHRRRDPQTHLYLSENQESRPPPPKTRPRPAFPPPPPPKNSRPISFNPKRKKSLPLLPPPSGPPTPVEPHQKTTPGPERLENGTLNPSPFPPPHPPPYKTKAKKTPIPPSAPPHNFPTTQPLPLSPALAPPPNP